MNIHSRMYFIEMKPKVCAHDADGEISLTTPCSTICICTTATWYLVPGATQSFTCTIHAVYRIFILRGGTWYHGTPTYLFVCGRPVI